MKLADIKDFTAGLGIADHVYSSLLADKKRQSIGVYAARRSDAYQTALGGHDLKSYGIRNVTFLVHWNKSPRETEEAATALFRALEATREVHINNETIKFIQLIYDEPIDVGPDDAGIFEMVIDAAVVYQKER